MLGLLGHGAARTLSPVMHNYAAQVLRQDCVYVNFNLEPQKVANFLDIFWHIGGLGLNVTVPHKTLVASLVQCQGLTSVNTLVRDAQGWRGHSTDGVGFVSGLERAGVKPDHFDMIVLLGSGGAAQSVLAALSVATAERPLTTVVHRRSDHHDEAIRQAIAIVPVQMIAFRPMTPESFADTIYQTQGLRRLIIQATSAPKFGDTLSQYPWTLDALTSDDFFVDLIYDRPSDLYFAAMKKDLRCQDGLPMLIEQARLSQHLWWGQSASYDDMLLAIKQSGWHQTLINDNPRV